MRGQQAHRPVQYHFYSGNVKEPFLGPRPLWCRCAFSLEFFSFFIKHLLLWVVDGGGFLDNWDFVSQEIVPELSTPPTYEAERTLDLPRRRSRQGTSPWLST